MWGPWVGDHDNDSSIVGVSDGTMGCDSDTNARGDGEMVK